MVTAPQGTYRPALMLAALTAALTLLLFPALTVYYANVYDFSLGLRDLLPPALLLSALTAAVLFLLTAFLPRAWRIRALSLLLMLALAAWAQANLLVTDYGVLDGAGIAWQEFRLQAARDVGLWLFALVLAFRFAPAIAAQAVTLCVALLALQVAGTALNARQAPPAPTHHLYTVSDEGQFEFSDQRNVIVIVLDAFQADIFQEILARKPDYAARLEGFHYFRNALAAYAKTYPSIPMMLSGQWYENDVPLEDFLRRAYMQHSLPMRLREQDWDVRLYPYFERTLWFDEAVADNFVRSRDPARRTRAFGQFVDTGLFRAVPQPLKRWWLTEPQGRSAGPLSPLVDLTGPRLGEQESQAQVTLRSEHPHEAVRWLEDMQLQAEVQGSQARFRFYHHFVPHAPFLLNEALEMENIPVSREGFYRHSLASINLMLGFLEELERLGVYDDSMVAIVSEHGGGEYRTGVDLELLPESLTAAAGPGTDMIDWHRTSGLPLMLIKPPAGRGELVISDAPASIADLADTLAGATGLDVDFGGHDLFAGEPPERERRYLQYEFDGWASAYLPAMTEYRVSGHSWLPQSWRLSGERLEPALRRDETEPAPPPELRTLRQGNSLRFGQDDAGVAYLRRGWSEPEAAGVWSMAQRARIELPLEGAEELAFRLHAFTGDGELEGQRVELTRGGEFLQQWWVDAPGWHRLSLPTEIRDMEEPLELELTFPDAASPADFLLSTDSRLLGVYLHEMVVGSGPVFRLGETWHFGDVGQGIGQFLGSGWSANENGVRWTDAESAEMALPLSGPLETGSLLLRLRTAPYLGGGALESQEVGLRSGDERLAEWSVNESDWYEARIPVELLDDDALLTLQLDISDPLAPSSLGDSPDERRLGLQAMELVIEHVD